MADITGVATGTNAGRVDVVLSYSIASIGGGHRVTATMKTRIKPGYTSTTYDNQGGCSVTINGNTKSVTVPINYKSNGTNWQSLCTHSVDIGHSGATTVGVSGSFSLGSTYITGGSASGNCGLPALVNYVTNGTPGNLALNPSTVKSGGSTTLSWSTPSGAISKYLIYTNNNGVLTGIGETTSNSYVINNITTSIGYAVQAIGLTSGSTVYNSSSVSPAVAPLVWTDVGVPTYTQYIGLFKAGRATDVSFTWSAGTNGTNNAISKYSIKKDGVVVYSPTALTQIVALSGAAGEKNVYVIGSIGTRDTTPIYSTTEIKYYSLGYTIPTVTIPSQYFNTLTVTLPTMSITKHSDVSTAKLNWAYTIAKAGTTVASGDLDAGETLTFSNADIAVGDTITLNLTPRIMIDTAVYITETVQVKNIINGAPANHATQVVFTNPQMDFVNDVYEKWTSVTTSPNYSLSHMTYTYANNIWDKGSNDSFRLTYNTTVTISMGALPAGVADATRKITGAFTYNNNNNIINVSKTSPTGIISFNVHDYFTEENFPKGKQITLTLKSSYVLSSGAEFTYGSTYDINLAVFTPQLPALNDVFSSLGFTNNVYDIDKGKGIVYLNGESIIPELSIDNIQVMNLDNVNDSIPTSYQGAGIKIISILEEIAPEPLPGVPLIVTNSGSGNWYTINGIADNGQSSNNIYYPEFSTIGLNLELNMLNNIWHQNKDLQIYAKKYKVTYQFTPLNLYGYEGATRQFTITYDTRLEPTMEESPLFILDGAPALSTQLIIGNFDKFRVFLCEPSPGKQNYCLFSFKEAYDNNKPDVYDEISDDNHRLKPSASDPCTYSLLRESYICTNGVWGWVKKDLIPITPMATPDATLPDSYCGRYYNTTEHKYYGQYIWQNQTLSNGEIIRLSVIPKAENQKSIELSLSSKSVNIIDNGITPIGTQPAIFIISNVFDSSLNINNITLPNDITAYSEIETSFSNLGTFNSYGSYIISDVNKLLDNNYNIRVDFTGKESESEINIKFSASATYVGNDLPSISNSTKKILFENIEGQITRIDTKLPYYVSILTTLSYPTYIKTIDNNKFKYTELSNTKVTEYPIYYQSPAYPTLSLQRGKVGINFNELQDETASLKVYPILTSNNYSIDIGQKGIRHVIDVVGNNSYVMPAYDGVETESVIEQEITEDSPKGSYIGFRIINNDTETWYGSIGFDDDGSAYIVTSVTSGNNRIYKKVRIGEVAELTEAEVNTKWEAIS